MTRGPVSDKYAAETMCEYRTRMNETNDCAVLAVALATDRTYEEVHKLCERYGRRRRCGTRFSITRKVLDDLGYKLVAVPFKGKTVATLKLPMGRFIVRTRGHILCYKCFRVHDHTEGRRNRIIEAWHVVRKEE